MTLKNAFADVALDASIRALTASVDALAGLTMKMLRVQQGERVIPYARTATDQLRAVIDSGATDIAAIRWGTNNTYPTWYSTGAGNSMDAREQMREASRTNARLVRSERWKFT
jgi:hypothetical protein